MKKEKLKKIEETDSLEKNQQEDITNHEDGESRKLAKHDFDNFGKRMNKLFKTEEEE